MFNPGRIGSQSFDLVDSVVAALVTGTKTYDTSMMVIGAQCRDLLHTAFGHTDLLRSTSDVDIAIAVAGDAEYRRIIAALPRSGVTDIRFSIAGMVVDLVPFGDIEDPAGTTYLPGRKESIDAFAFREVFTHSIELRLPSGYQVRIPTPAGYTGSELFALQLNGGHFEEDRNTERYRKYIQEILIVLPRWPYGCLPLGFELRIHLAIDGASDPRRGAWDH
ncbi:hypothetical protein [Nocardia sp. NPDC049149]|uniref:hypothetical protein n=1 Tax=Nocardia sp. NPDC049149 TaxID=3364315 RepID=UPI0037184F77